MSAPGPLGRLALWSIQRRVPVLVGAILLFVLATLGAGQLKVDSNLLSLLPDEEPSAHALKELVAQEGGVNLVTIAVEAQDPAKLDPWLDDLVVKLEELDSVRYALHEVDPDLAFRLGLLQLEPKEVETLTRRLKGALALGSALNPIVTQQLMDMGPLTEKIGRAGDAQIFPSEGEGQGRVLARPTGAASDPVFATQVMQDIDRVIAAADPDGNGIRVRWIGGAYRHNVEDRAGMVKDIQYTGVASGLMVLLAIIVAFRSVRATVLLYAPLLLSTALNLVVLWLMFGSVNTYTSFGSAILFGLGIDYGTHLVARYREKRALGYGLEEAVVRAWDKTGPPTLTSCITSIAGFLALSTAHFQGFSQLGITLATGLAISVVVAMVVTPALIPWLDADPPLLLGASHKENPHARKATYRLAPAGLMLAILLTGLAATRLSRIDWEYDISALRRDGLAYAELSPEEQTLAKESYSPVVLTYPNRLELTREHQRLTKLVADGKLPHVSRVVSVENVLPLDQDARVQAIAELAKLTTHPNLRYLPPPLVKNLLKLRGFEARSLRRDDLPPGLLGLLGAANADHHRLLLFPKGNMWDLREAGALKDEVMAAVPGKVPAGEYVALGALYRIVVADMPLVAALALALVAALTAIDLRKFSWFVAAYGTLLAGMIWAGVAIEAMGVKMSILNIVGVPILVGIGVDVCIHLLHRIAEEGPGGVMRALRTTGIAAIVSTLTTVTSFASLMLAGNRGIRSLGLLVAVGLTMIFFATAALMPLAWAAGWRITGRAPGDTRPRKNRRLFTKGGGASGSGGS